MTLATSAEYTQEERELLLQLAHRSIQAVLDCRGLDLTSPSAHLAEMRGAFTTLHLEGRLRGCIGYVVPTNSLYQTVAETARAAAFDDPRFPPVTPDEAPQLKVEISVLSRLHPVRPENVVTGVHGLIVAKGGRRGLLLPQVPVEWHWDRETFLSQTCLKAGLPPDAWMQDIDLQAFTAEVFGEESPAERSE
ncbi:MAG TPA: AmmeMemoRadiSam system protein A [Candidatus Limnocylindrales bacterium]|nr:AmmeMemoRadiSam system protein A [Candidatus Limnocylindrales bacterium]